MAATPAALARPRAGFVPRLAPAVLASRRGGGATLLAGRALKSGAPGAGAAAQRRLACVMALGAAGGGEDRALHENLSQAAETLSERQLARARQAAAARAAESRRADALFQDEYAACLEGGEGEGEGARGAAEEVEEVLLTAAIDEQLLNIIDDALVAGDEIRQVVLVGPGMDTRPYRLPWPAQTALFSVGIPAVLQAEEEALAQVGAKPPKGCVLRRVPAGINSGAGEEWTEKLANVGYRGDKKSVWALVGCCGLSTAQIGSVVMECSLSMAAGTVLVGELPLRPDLDPVKLLAGYELLGTVGNPWDLPAAVGRAAAAGLGRTPADGPGRVLIRAVQRRRSEAEDDLFNMHARAIEEAGDEDYYDNIT